MIEEKKEIMVEKVYLHVTPAIRTATVNVVNEVYRVMQLSDYKEKFSISFNTLALSAYTKSLKIITDNKNKYGRDCKLSLARKGGYDKKATVEELNYEIESIVNADEVIIYVPEYKSSGWLAMLGYALAKGKHVYVFGDIDKFNHSTLFALHPELTTFKTLEECFYNIVILKSSR